MSTFWSDLRYASRWLIRKPAFTATIVLTVAIGIGANTAMFTVVNSVLLQPLPYDDPDELVLMYGSFPLNQFASVSPPDFLDYREQLRSFESFAAATSFMRTFNVTGGSRPERIDGAFVTAGLFATLGAKPALGRTFRLDEENDASRNRVILSHGLWTHQYGGDPGIVGSTIQLDGEAQAVVGVMPAGFDYPAGARLWKPLPFHTEETSARRFHFLRPVARLAPGVDLATAQAEADVVAEQLAAAYPESNDGWSLNIVPMHTAIFGASRTPLLILLGAAGLVLLIGCGNVASLLLARSSTREREIAVRTALGASRFRVARQLLTESLVLALIGGVAGVGLAIWALEGLIALAPAGLPRADRIAIDGGVLLFALAMSLLTAFVFGLAPAIQASLGTVAGSLRSTGWSLQSRSGSRVRSAMVVGQVGLSLVLLIGAGLLLQSLWRLQSVDPGFEADGLFHATVTLSDERYEEADARRGFYDELIRRMDGLPGVVSASAADILPLTGFGNDTYVWVEGHEPEPGQAQTAQTRTVTDRYFETMRTPLLRGRVFDGRERADGPASIIVTQSLARRFFGDDDPLGQRLVVDLGESVIAEIVGIVGDTRQFSLASPPDDTMYFALSQRPRRGMRLLLRTGGDPLQFAAVVENEVHAIDGEIPVSDVGTMSQNLDAATGGARFQALLLGLFAGVALLLSAVGLYGVLSWFVNQRMREVGIRVALGARSADVMALVAGRGMTLAGLGLALGLLSSIAATRLMSGIVYQVGVTDPSTFAGVTGVLLVVAAITCYLPARRATKVSPMIALRHD